MLNGEEHNYNNNNVVLTIDVKKFNGSIKVDLHHFGFEERMVYYL